MQDYQAMVMCETQAFQSQAYLPPKIILMKGKMKVLDGRDYFIHIGVYVLEESTF